MTIVTVLNGLVLVIPVRVIGRLRATQGGYALTSMLPVIGTKRLTLFNGALTVRTTLAMKGCYWLISSSMKPLDRVGRPATVSHSETPLE